MKTTAFSAIIVILLAASVSAAEVEVKPIHALLITGGCCHDYINQKKILTEGVSARANVRWTIVHQGGTTTNDKIGLHENENWADGYDVIVHNECFAEVTDKDFVQRVLKPHKAGKPAVVIHCAMHNYRDKTDEWFKFTGITSHSHGANYPFEVINIKKDHPIMEGFPDTWKTPKGELYFSHKVWETATPLGHAMSRDSKKNEVCIWVNDYNKGTRVFGTTVGHHNEEMSDPVFLTYVTRGLLWSVDKLNETYLKPASKDLKTIEIDPFGTDGKSPRPADAPLAPGQKKVSATIRPGTKVPVNLAVGKKASAPRSQEGHDPGHAIDASAETRWCAPDWNTQYTWLLDLGQAEDITGINIAWEKEDAAYGYKVDASDDGKAWRTLIDTTEKPLAGELHQHVAHTRTRHLRLTITKLKAGCWASFWEFEVLGKELIEAGKPGASSLLWLDRPAAAATDGLLAQVKIAPGYKATLFAAPPQVNYPTCIAAAPTGEVFIGIDENGSLGKDGKRAMKVIRAIDTDGDGKADRFTDFCKINNPRGLFFHDHTLIVLGPPNLRAFTDTNGDGIADTEKLLVSGLGSPALAQRGADHCTNGFGVGIDGWLYIAVGDFGAIKAQGSDGQSVQLHGGGIIRVRPDGSEIEIVTRGQRNIYDVAIDPLLNMFTRDNTNDGDGWNVRLSHIIQGGNYGYPSLFKNFSDDIIQPLADYGGGSPTGSLYIDEPGLGEGASGLMTCDWGRSIIYRHPLAADGAGFKAQQKTFIELPRPTDMDVDGSGRIYISSWREGGFSYAKPDVGYVVRVTASDAKPATFPDLRKATDVDLISHLASASHVARLHAQREILRRGESEALTAGITSLARGTAAIPVRVAAIFTLKQMRGAKSNDALAALAKDATVREFVLRALADRLSQNGDVPVQPFISAVSDASPRVRLQAATGIGRLGRLEYAGAIVPLVADGDALVRHIAVHGLVSMKAAEVCFKALDSGDASLEAGALRVLRSLNETAVVDGLIQRLGRASDATMRQQIVTALCRLYNKEADWTGDWWNTRPDTRGPYYNPVVWEGSARIAPVLLAALSTGDAEMGRFVVGELSRHRIKLDDVGQLVRMAASDASLRPAAVAMLLESAKLPPDAIPLLESVAISAKEDATLRARAATALGKAIDQPAALDAAINAFASLATTGGAAEPVLLARESFAKDKRHPKNVTTFIKLVADKDAGKRETAFSVLLVLASDKQLPKSAVAAGKAIDAGWSSADAGSLLRAVALVNAKDYSKNVRAFLGDTRPAVREAAQATARQLKILGEETADPNKITIAKLGFDKAAALMKTETGDAKLGKELFTKQGCIQCHTVAPEEPLKGPLLLGISQRYSRAELVESILKPGAKVSQGFETQWFQMEDGLNYEGFVVRESADEIEMRNVAGAVTVLKKKEVEERGKRETSMMPNGLADALDAKEFASILAYLESLKAK
jgi:putative heme-binding domain-containing protein